MPLYLSSLIHWNCNTLNTRSQSWLSLYLPHVNTKLGKTAFCYKAPYIWNEVQKSLRLCSFISLREFLNLITCKTDFSCNDCNCWLNHSILLNIQNCYLSSFPCTPVLFYMHISFFFFFKLYFFILFSNVLIIHCTLGTIANEGLIPQCVFRGLNK